LESALLTISGNVGGAGHSAHAVRNYDRNGKPTNWTVFEVGPRDSNSGKIAYEQLSSNPLDPIQAILAGSLGGSSVSSSSGIASGSTSGTFSTAGGTVVTYVIHAGVSLYTVYSLNELKGEFDRITIFNTTREQDQSIFNASRIYGENFGNYNILTNNCSQYAARALAAGGINTTNNPIPNVAHTYAEKNNKDKIKNK
jgi:hypothetical protein